MKGVLTFLAHPIYLEHDVWGIVCVCGGGGGD